MQLILWAVIIFGSIALDQWTKLIAETHLTEAVSIPVIDGVFGWNLYRNDGAAFGMWGGFRWPLIIVSSAAILAIAVFMVVKRKKIPPLLGIAMAMIVGGGIGNQIDRIASGLVVDFLEFLFIDFAVFNVADCFVTVGAVLAAIDLIFIDRQFLFDEPKAEPVSASEEPSAESADEPVAVPHEDESAAAVSVDSADTEKPEGETDS